MKEMPPRIRTFLDDLARLTDGLLYPSETDAEFTPGVWDRPYPWEAEGKRVEEVAAADFFAALRDHPDAAGFHALHEFAGFHLLNLRVLRVGMIRVEVYIVGEWRAPEEALSPSLRVGLATWSVET